MAEIGIFPLELVLLPTERVPLHIFEDRYKEMIGHCLDEHAEFGIVWLADDGLKEIGAAPADIAIVINTHLHFDHAGGNTRTRPDGSLEIAFPNATYLVRRGELDYALHPNERTGASYFDRNYVPIEAAGKLELLTREKELRVSANSRTNNVRVVDRAQQACRRERFLQ